MRNSLKHFRMRQKRHWTERLKRTSFSETSCGRCIHDDNDDGSDDYIAVTCITFIARFNEL